MGGDGVRKKNSAVVYTVRRYNVVGPTSHAIRQRTRTKRAGGWRLTVPPLSVVPQRGRIAQTKRKSWVAIDPSFRRILNTYKAISFEENSYPSVV